MIAIYKGNYNKLDGLIIIDYFGGHINRGDVRHINRDDVLRFYNSFWIDSFRSCYVGFPDKRVFVVYEEKNK